MKKYLLSSVIALLFVSCEKDPVPGDTVEVAVPVTLTIADFRASVAVNDPKNVEESGKIYTYKNYIFINDINKGVLVLENSNYNPIKKKFLKIPGNTDIAIKDEILYANSGRDLVTFDISDINNIKVMERLEDVFDDYHPPMPAGAAYADYSGVRFGEDIIVGYTLETRPKPEDSFLFDRGGWVSNSANESSTTGTGGSMARFNIAGDYLYTVSPYTLNVFDIGNSINLQKLRSESVGWQIETIFNKEGFLYLGSAVGMYIYSIEDPSTPLFMSHVQHVMGCDPVVVDGDIAYVTIRGGNECGQNNNQLEIIDVKDKANPQLLKIYQMDSPYGLGIHKDKLFVCEGPSGLKVYNTANTPELVLTDHFEDVNAYDVIPGESVLIMIGENKLRQYSYKSAEITLISTFEL
ncbi:hypothetical protein FK178_10000 [Antarcticibacterium arcticum]|uniref:LVIVD repeat-containing protein n=1 Tax=Antarcticibacterium arcticum TaxID=2585771 RepID=A0A5B8YK56_9FLAO|nr:hypothetical protein [Antarcticibacterium arcticum]QED38035.1 hypothetical protein FK178_10000 [Antarcticibacterium arcticum]